MLWVELLYNERHFSMNKTVDRVVYTVRLVYLEKYTINGEGFAKDMISKKVVSWYSDKDLCPTAI